MLGGMTRARLVSLGLSGALALGAMAHPAAALSDDEAAAQVEAQYGVEVLRVRADTIDGTAVWLITVMKPGGDSNDAFQVTTLAMDQATGRLVPAFRHGPSGPAQPDGAGNTQIDRRPDLLRSGDVWR